MRYFWIGLLLIVLALILILTLLLTKKELAPLAEIDSIEEDLIELSVELTEAQNLFDTIYSNTP